MTEQRSRNPAVGDDFPEEERVRDGPVREEILTMVVEALNAQGYPDLDVSTLPKNRSHKRAVIDMLRDCRPMPVVLELIDDIENDRELPATEAAGRFHSEGQQ